MVLQPIQDFISQLAKKNILAEKEENQMVFIEKGQILVYFYENETAETLLKIRAHQLLNSNRFTVFVSKRLWEIKPNVILSKIVHLCQQSIGLHGRKMKIQEVDKDMSMQFIQDNHLFPPLPGYKRLGLFQDQQLVAVGVFSKKRKFRDGSYSAELLQFSTLNFHHINGGLNKLIQEYVRLKSIDSIMTYVDLNWSDGKAFESAGFKIIDTKYNSTNHSNPLFKIESMGSLKLVKCF